MHGWPVPGIGCVCQKDYVGVLCDHRRHCENGDLDNGFVDVAWEFEEGICICDSGWDGIYCDEIVCVNGTLSAQNKSHCDCDDYFTGAFCDICSFTLVIGLASAITHFTDPDCRKELVPFSLLLFFPVFVILLMAGIVFAFVGPWRRETRDWASTRYSRLRESITNTVRHREMRGFPTGLLTARMGKQVTLMPVLLLLPQCMLAEPMEQTGEMATKSSPPHCSSVNENGSNPRVRGSPF